MGALGGLTHFVEPRPCLLTQDAPREGRPNKLPACQELLGTFYLILEGLHRLDILAVINRSCGV
jgi:hypothetical protein